MKIYARNRKRPFDFGVIYSMERIVGAVALRIDVAISKAEMQYGGRAMAAHRLRRARAEIHHAVMALTRSAA